MAVATREAVSVAEFRFRHHGPRLTFLWQRISSSLRSRWLYVAWMWKRSESSLKGVFLLSYDRIIWLQAVKTPRLQKRKLKIESERIRLSLWQGKRVRQRAKSTALTLPPNGFFVVLLFTSSYTFTSERVAWVSPPTLRLMPVADLQIYNNAAWPGTDICCVWWRKIPTLKQTLK